MEFDTSLNSALNMQTDLLIDIFCWQQIILDRIAAQEAEKNQCSKADVMEVWKKAKTVYRQSLIEEIYGKHGPDLPPELFGK